MISMSDFIHDQYEGLTQRRLDETGNNLKIAQQLQTENPIV